MDSIKTVCPECKEPLPYKAVLEKEIEQPYQFKNPKEGAFCWWCGAKLIPELEEARAHNIGNLSPLDNL